VGAATDSQTLNLERCALRGGTLQRLAGLYAGQVLQAAAPGTSAGRALVTTLWASAHAYFQGEGSAGRPGLRPQHALKRLALQALLLQAGKAGQVPQAEAGDGAASTPAGLVAVTAAQALELAHVCEDEARRAFESQPDARTALLPMEAQLAQALLDGSLAQEATQARERLLQAWRIELQRLMTKPRELDAALRRLCRLARLADALYVHSGAPALWYVAAHLVTVANALGSAACKRADAAGPAPEALQVSPERATPLLPPPPPPTTTPARQSARTSAPAKKAGTRRKR
jgi:hypothetical protein